MKRRQCSAIFVGNIRRQTRLHGQKSVQILAPQLCSNSFLQPLMFGLESTEELVHVRLPVIKKEIEAYKGMPGRDSTEKCFEV